jgi:DNA polymerase IIIc chi subunit
MKQHFEGKHDVTAGYTCPICEKTLKTSNKRQIHVKDKHGLQMSEAHLWPMNVSTMRCKPVLQFEPEDKNV